MANYAKPLSFLLVMVFFATLKVEAARDHSKYFSKLNSQVDQPSLKPSSELKNDNDDFNFENPENDVSPEEFIESMKKNPSETKAFSRDFDEPSYMTGPQTFREKDGDDDLFNLNKEDVLANDGFKLTEEEKKFFNKDTEEEKKFFNKKDEEKNSFNTYNNDDGVEEKNSYNDRENVFATKAQGMSDTRTLENGKYFYNPRVVRGNSGNNPRVVRGNSVNKDDEFRL